MGYFKVYFNERAAKKRNGVTDEVFVKSGQIQDAQVREQAILAGSKVVEYLGVDASRGGARGREEGDDFPDMSRIKIESRCLLGAKGRSE